MKKFFDLATGDGKRFELTYLKLYGKSDHSAEIEIIKKGNLKKYIYLIAAGLILFSAAAVYKGLNPAGSITIKNGDETSVARPAESEDAIKIPMRLDASWGHDEKLTRNVVILVLPEEPENTAEVAEPETEAADVAVDVEAEIRKAVKMINRSSADRKLVLPSELAGGIKLRWEESYSSNMPVLFALFLLAGVVLYRNRYARLKKMENEAKESIIRDLPEFINKIVLLLNAGLVLTSAFDRILENYGPDRKGVSYFYLQLLQVERSKHETNGSMMGGLKDFAGRSGVREFARVVGIMADNIDKGAEFVEKLQGESELLWLTKKKLAEEKGRLAETKLTFPLVLLLLILIMVTIAPALMEM